ncbi:tRNA (adenosine(37)-N6)-threonylcarbamoyltransferase complex ATPase subunit type 1 TsaE, partial [Patescibacteria group bacterium]|nr:tRNA (adenosine(37)-N6)-threonylcarbamoyltransferase complex ATPase subunit type 1 TsaE [Patescibacteria group bacterium]
MRYKTKNEKETQKIALDFAKELRGGEMILLYGDLGAGKTVFVKGLAKALGIVETVKSPTFNILKCYDIPK